MHLVTRNVNSAFRELVSIFANNGVTTATPDKWTQECVPIIKRPSRNGSVMMIDEPVTITYTHPRERVLFNAARDANPFFHVFEALWMLAGRNDVDSVAYYAKQMREYSDNGKTLNGAYGYRWRHHIHHRLAENPTCDETNIKTDQLDILVAHLKADPNSRRAVLQMWNVEDDLLKIGNTEITGYMMGFTGQGTGPIYKPGSKDVCCNLSVMFSIREDYGTLATAVKRIESGGEAAATRYLDMTVTNRSNDMIWGLLGANHVHFSFLQEYMAARIGVEVGKYHHFTNNLHVYDWNWKPEAWLADAEDRQAGYEPFTTGTHRSGYSRAESVLSMVPLMKDPKVFEEELQSIVQFHNGMGVNRTWNEPFFADVARPMLQAFLKYKESKDFDTAMRFCAQIKADDWRIAAKNWIERRMVTK